MCSLGFGIREVWWVGGSRRGVVTTGCRRVKVLKLYR